MSEILSTAISGDRRSKRRYPIHVPLNFKARKTRLVFSAGTGTVLNMSSTGIAFASDETVHPGMSINLSITWPVLLEGKTRIMLVADGTVVRTEGQIAAVKVSRYEFRTRKQ